MTLRERLYNFAGLLMLIGFISPWWPFRPGRPFWTWGYHPAWERSHETLEGRLVFGLAAFAIGLVLAIACRPRR